MVAGDGDIEEEKERKKEEEEVKERREERKLAVMMMSRKRRKLYDRIMEKRTKKTARVRECDECDIIIVK